MHLAASCNGKSESLPSRSTDRVCAECPAGYTTQHPNWADACPSYGVALHKTSTSLEIHIPADTCENATLVVEQYNLGLSLGIILSLTNQRGTQPRAASNYRLQKGGANHLINIQYVARSILLLAI